MLYELAMADKNGEMELFARQNGIILIDNTKIRIRIKPRPGQLCKAAIIAAKYGQVTAVSPVMNSLEAVIPVSNLTRLADEPSIVFIEIPVLTK